MEKSVTINFFSELKRIFWPIEWHEHKKFLPMAGIMFCILFNYSALRSIKDGFVVVSIGPEAISFVKTYIVLPTAVLMMIVYAKLCNIMSQTKVFHTICSFFIVFFSFFALVLYPYPKLFHPDSDTINHLAAQYPAFQWLIKIGGQWTLAAFYTASELYGSMMLSLLFWQFANQITKTLEAKRFYSMFGVLGNIALLLVAIVLNYLLSDKIQIVSAELKFIPVILLTSLSGLLIMLLYSWINNNVLTDPRFYDAASSTAPKKQKAKLSLYDSFKMILNSRYLGLLVILVLAYGISINLVEGVWKSKIRQMYPSREEYTIFMGTFQAYQGVTAIIFMLIGSNILRRVSWKTAAIFTPIMILITGAIFFALIIFDKSLGLYLVSFFGTGPLALAITVGMAQNVLSKATKYSLFDSTKEMAYIPLDTELQTKGKAAVEVIGGRFGKSGGGIIQSTFFLLLPYYSFVEATPYFAIIFFIIVILWIFAVQSLSKEYQAKIDETKNG